MNQPRTPQDRNPAQQRRSAMMRAVSAQQKVIEQQQADLNGLVGVVATLVTAAGLSKHPTFAPMVSHARTAGLMPRHADSAQNPDGAPATSTQQAAAPQATDDVESKGAAPSEANKDVTPAGVTDVNNSDVTVNPPVLDNLTDPTMPTAGTDKVDPMADASHGETSQVEVTKPAEGVMDPAGSSGWKASSLENRFAASIRLARLQIEAGMATGEDIALGQAIASGNTSMEVIESQISTLSALKANASQGAPRRLVPRSASQTATPSMVAGAAAMPAVTAGARGDEDEFLVLGDGAQMYDLG